MPFVVPDPRDLCTLDDVKALMQKVGPNASAQDTLISSLITRASIKIMRDTGREFVPGGPTMVASVAATRTFEYTWGGLEDEAFTDLYPYDLQIAAVPTITVDTDTTSPVVLTTDQYRLWPQPPVQGVFMAVRIRLPGSNIVSGWRNRQLQVTGDWGFPAIPFEVTQAAAETVIHWLTNYPASRRPDAVDAAAAPSVPRSYPMTAVDLLSSFRRMAI